MQLNTTYFVTVWRFEHCTSFVDELISWNEKILLRRLDTKLLLLHNTKFALCIYICSSIINKSQKKSSDNNQHAFQSLNFKLHFTFCISFICSCVKSRHLGLTSSNTNGRPERKCLFIKQYVMAAGCMKLWNKLPKLSIKMLIKKLFCWTLK